MVATRRTSARLATKTNEQSEDTQEQKENTVKSESTVNEEQKTRPRRGAAAAALLAMSSPAKTTRQTRKTTPKKTDVNLTPTPVKRSRTRGRGAQSVSNDSVSEEAVVQLEDNAQPVLTPTPSKRGRCRPNKQSAVDVVQPEDEEVVDKKLELSDVGDISMQEQPTNEISDELNGKQVDNDTTVKVKPTEEVQDVEEEEMLLLSDSDAEADDDTTVQDKLTEEVQDAEEEEILLLNDSSDEEGNDQQQLEEEDKDFDVLSFATLAATGINLNVNANASKFCPSTSSLSTTSLVPDRLDSGASNRVKYLSFQGTKTAQGATICPEVVAREEQIVLKKQLGKVAKANRQRTEALDTSTASRKWHNMTSHEMTEDAKRDFALLKMRNYLDPKKFYKSTDHDKNLPKHFQVGTVIEGAHEFKSARLTKKQRQQTFTEEIMADEQIRNYTKRVFNQIQSRTNNKYDRGKHKRTKHNSHHRHF